MVVILVSIYANVFLWTSIQNDIYNREVIHSMQMDSDRFNEKIVAKKIFYTIWGTTVNVKATIVNEGPIPVKIITLWVEDITVREYGFKNNLNIVLDSGGKYQLDVDVTVNAVASGHELNIFIITARGNRVVLTRSYAEVSSLTEAMGPILFKYETFRWYSVQSGHSGTWEISRSEKKVVWSVNLTNWMERDISLSYDSMLMILSGSQGMVWYIKEPYVLKVNEEVTIYFCWQKPGGVGNYIESLLPPEGTYTVIIVLVGTYSDGGRYAQTIPFSAVKITA
jgi:hypothetical protein